MSGNLAKLRGVLIRGLAVVAVVLTYAVSSIGTIGTIGIAGLGLTAASTQAEAGYWRGRYRRGYWRGYGGYGYRRSYYRRRWW